ncbi:unnamed protein product [Moneuplotes crassus]|uniref:THH1/TOM1/TOM3 domain-containing protein n=1 Tax=Euplotes crassus TaxID=5936 RepID=A0AAD1XLC8_EUPCR|nr:unnamed protein product [Moneuplotes crassus]
MVIYSSVGVLTLLFQLWYFTKYLRIYGVKHRLTCLFMFFLTLSILCDIAYGVSQVYFKRYDDCIKYTRPCLNYWAYWLNYLMYLNTIIVLSFTYVLQIFKLQNVRRRRMAYKLIIWAVMLILLAALTIAFVIDGLNTCEKNPNHVVMVTPMILILTGAYMVVGGFFTVILFIFYKTLKKRDINTHGIKLSNKIKWRLIISALVIFIAFEVRSSMVLALSKKDFFAKWKEDSLTNNKLGFIFYNFCYYCFLSLIPTMIQIYLIKLSLSTTPKVSVWLTDNYGQGEFLIPRDFDFSDSYQFESHYSIDPRHLNSNTS